MGSQLHTTMALTVYVFFEQWHDNKVVDFMSTLPLIMEVDAKQKNWES